MPGRHRWNPQIRGDMVNGEDSTASEFCYDIPLLLQLFESLGENCDFGVVQRAVGIEPLGLFRFAACDAVNVAGLLRARLQPLGEPEDLWLEEVGPDREFCIRSRHFTFKAHTDRYAGRDDPAVVQMAQVMKMRVLKARLIRDLSRARRLFVYKGDCEIALIQEIVAGLRGYGPNSLLWVRQADAAHPPGSVIRISDGLLLGFVDRSGSYDGDPSGARSATSRRAWAIRERSGLARALSAPPGCPPRIRAAMCSDNSAMGVGVICGG